MSTSTSKFVDYSIGWARGRGRRDFQSLLPSSRRNFSDRCDQAGVIIDPDVIMRRIHQLLEVMDKLDPIYTIDSLKDLTHHTIHFYADEKGQIRRPEQVCYLNTWYRPCEQDSAEIRERDRRIFTIDPLQPLARFADQAQACLVKKQVVDLQRDIPDPYLESIRMDGTALEPRRTVLAPGKGSNAYDAWLFRFCTILHSLHLGAFIYDYVNSDPKKVRMRQEQLRTDEKAFSSGRIWKDKLSHLVSLFP